jgi:hypothetical protein
LRGPTVPSEDLRSRTRCPYDAYPLLRVYRHDRTPVGQPVALDGEEHRADVGTYSIEYVVPDAGVSALVIEFSRVVGEKPTVERTVLPVEWLSV